MSGPADEEQYTFSEMSSALGKSPRVIRSLQISIGVYIPPKRTPYPERYMHFMRKVVSLRTFNVPFELIKELIAKETKILEMLNFDTMSDSPIWYMAGGDGSVQSTNHLLLTGHDVGFDVTRGDVQCNLDFSPREAELFDPKEMGEDIHRAIELYLEILTKVDKRVRGERPVLIEALAWAGSGLMP